VTDSVANHAPLDGLTFHHLGVACADIREEIGIWAALGYRPEGAPFVDATQGVNGLFMVGGGPRIELLEANEGSETLAPWIKRRVKFYHAGYTVPSLNKAIAAFEAVGATVARPSMPSTYFKTSIAFLLMPNMALIELIEANSDTSPEPPGATP
jgi:methylmalonyl-CoA/ethylmalonyl-CoA epimerase